MTGKRILIIGGYGFVGRHLLRAVAADSSALAVLARTGPDMDSVRSLPAHEFLAADLACAEVATEQIRRFRPDTIFHLASRPDGAENLAQTRKCIVTNVLGTLQVLEGARQTGATLVIGDSVKSYGNTGARYTSLTPEAPNSSYAISKVAAWNTAKLYAASHGVKVTAIRPTLIYGPGEGLNLIEYVLNCVAENQSEIVLDGGTQTRDPLYISDAIRAYVAAANNIDAVLGEAINIGGGTEYSIHDIADAIVRIAGGDAEIKDRPGKSRPTEIWRSACDNSDVIEKLGWKPKVTLEAGIDQIVQYRRAPYLRQLKTA
ncbi:putative dTDP-glucose 4,6-dehydratase [uncultured Woeseiaceae bacterium]|uniref:Putative dTDP-glucose 4,6-dehydratase n=1 Tax=uncultured Woeseiaceae bacterium TaxID=1983305 RepID=A0A7D9H6J4_9GAMM|nr:putative dTDP-glucose 4,6-dehydratase [uncultured Woeseiaceae bacterium]